MTLLLTAVYFFLLSEKTNTWILKTITVGVYIILLNTTCSGTQCCWLFSQFLSEFISFFSKMLVQS